ncbi:MAG: GGDEF domain-containing protein [Defluviitaleaceae bacterium]|nr:GGDEF domain-containing protein [Defluviitaleaceae bacterium]
MENKRLHFGVLLSTMENTCQHEIWDGIVEYAQLYDIHLTAFIGTYQTTNYNFASHLETCFDMISKNSLDGIIIFAGFIAQIIGAENFEKYIARIPKNIPIVSVSFSMPGVQSVLADNETGIFSAVEHLIKVHGKKKIAFVKGPDGHSEAEERFDGYKKALAANEIEFDEQYVLPGDFSQESGHAAVVELFNNRKLSADAIVSSDDETAIGVLNQLKYYNISVPKDIAVTGFDDDRNSAMFIPSISTSRQNFYKIGMVSAETLCKKIAGTPVEDVQYVESVFVARQSCGCLEKEFTRAEQKSNLEASFISLFRHVVPREKIKEWTNTLVEKMKEEPFNQEEFLQAFDEILMSFNTFSKEFFMWHEAINILATWLKSSPVLASLIFAKSLVNEIHHKEQRVKEFAQNDSRMLLRRVTSTLVLIFETSMLAETLHELLPELSLNTALIGLYKNPIKSSDSSANREIDVLIGFDGEQKFNMRYNQNPILFSDYSTITDFNFERERRTFFFIPLFFKDEEVGVMLLPYDPKIQIDAYETLRVNIAAAAKGAELLSTIQALSVTDELTGLLNRRGFFQFAHSRISHLKRRTEVLPHVMFMDMDGLKFINDTFGHKEGDIAIATFAKILKDALREEDIVGRLGGDEFVVLSSVTSKENGEHVVKRIRQELETYNSQKLHPYNIAASIGSVVLSEATKECLSAAMLNADNVLYEEKMAKKKQGLSRG